MSQTFTLPNVIPVNGSGTPYGSAKIYFYRAGTTTDQTVYTDLARLTPHAQPVQADANGLFPVIYLDQTASYDYRIQIKTSAGALIKDQDGIPRSASADVTIEWTQLKYDQTAAEISASVTPTNYYQPPQALLRYGNNTVPGTTDVTTAFQSAIDSCDALSSEIVFSQTTAISKPLLIRSTAIPNTSIHGKGRVTSIIVPLAADIKVAPVSVNALIINQRGSGQAHLHLKSMRFGPDATAYTGVALYCKSGGGSDASVQALFSAVIDDCWFGFSSNNTGYCRGGFSNLQVSKCVFESTKLGCFVLEGAGNADQQYIGNVMNNSYDSFIYGDIDTLTKAVISVVGLHAYQHQRGPLISISNGVEMSFQDIIVEASSANIGTVGLFNFTDCTDVIATNCLATTANGEPKCATGIRIVNSHKGKYSNMKISATLGVEFLGTGALDVTFEDIDFIGCDTAVQWTSGTLSGDITFRGCRMNDNQLYGMIVLAGTHSWNLTLIDCEIVNAGLNTVVTNRNIDMNTSGKVKLIRLRIGQNSASAAAAFYIRANGAGTFEVIDPIIVGTAPSGFSTGAQAVSLDGVNSDMLNMSAFSPTPGGTVTFTGTPIGYWSLKNKVCNFYADFTVNVIGTGSATVISGLPITSHATMYGGGLAHFFSASASNITGIFCSVSPGGTGISLRSLVAAGAATANNAIMQNGTRVIVQGSYPTP